MILERELPQYGTKTIMVDRLVTSCEEGASGLRNIDHTFARDFSKWILQPKTKGSGGLNVMYIGNENEPVMLVQLVYFLQQNLKENISLTALCEVGLDVQ